MYAWGDLVRSYQFLLFLQVVPGPHTCNFQ